MTEKQPKKADPAPKGKKLQPQSPDVDDSENEPEFGAPTGFELVPPNRIHGLVARVLGIVEYPVRLKDEEDEPTHNTWAQKIYEHLPNLPKLPGLPGPRTTKELYEPGWQPVRMMVKKHWPMKDIETKWFEDIYSHLYFRASEFAEDYFGYGEIPFASTHSSVWLAGFSADFKQYASEVARQDNSVGGWDDLLLSGHRREHLVTAIIARILHKLVWETYLFGASEAQRKMLEAQDKLTAGLDGYPRTKARSDTIRSLLGGNIVTPYFWRDIDRLAFELINILLPLIRIMDAKFPARSKPKSLRIIHQDLHNIVTEAAFLSIGIRWSPDIFRFVWPIPGQSHDGNHEDSISNELYNESKKFAQNLDEIRQRSRAEKAALLQEKQKALAQFSPTARVISTTYEFGLGVKDTILNGVIRLAMFGQDALSIQAKQDGFSASHGSRLAKVHIATWPCLVRHTVVGKLGSHPILGNLDAEGETIVTIMKAPVVYYYGLDDAPGEYSERIPTVDEWVVGRRLARFWGFVNDASELLIGGLLAWLVLSVLRWYFPLVDGVVGAVGVSVGRFWRTWVRVWGLEVSYNMTKLVIGLVHFGFFFFYAAVNSISRLFGMERPLGGPTWKVNLTEMPEPWYGSIPKGYPQFNLYSFRILWRCFDSLSMWMPYHYIRWAYVGDFSFRCYENLAPIPLDYRTQIHLVFLCFTLVWLNVVAKFCLWVLSRR